MGFPTFASGDVLLAADMNAVAGWLVKKVTIGTSVASVPVTGAFSSSYENYLIVVNGGVGSASAVMRLTFDSIATGYYYAGVYASYGAAGTAISTAANATSFADCGSITTNNLNMMCYVYGPNLAKTTQVHYAYAGAATTAGAGGLWLNGGGYVTSTNQHVDFTLTPSTGTLTGGTVRVYGLRN